MEKLKEEIVEMIYGYLPYSTKDSIRANVDEILSLIEKSEPGAKLAWSDRVIKQTFDEEKQKFDKEIERHLDKGNRKGAIKLEERLNGIRCIEEKLRAKGIAL